MTNTFHATPYDTSASGFYFTNYDGYTEQAAKHRNQYGDLVEEFEIQYIDGEQYKLFETLYVNQANLKQWFDDYEDLGGEELIKAIYLAEDLHCDMDEILDKLDDVSLFQGTAEEYADEYIDDTGMLNDLPENLHYYFDTKAFARDMLLNGDITEIIVDGTNYIVWGV